MPDLAVILCTRNPRVDYLEQVLTALRGQTLPLTRWELLLVDSASDEPLAQRIDLSWHPAGRHVTLTKPGLTPARLAGFAASTAEVLVMVDDDNVLAADYLAECLRIAERYPWVGAWGGNVELVCETEPPAWLHRYRGVLAERHYDRVYWSNHYLDAKVPCGAGMGLRRSVFQAYADKLANDPSRQALDRTGDSLLSDGDTDLALIACDLGLGLGAFPSLGFRHLIPAKRLNFDYILRLHTAMIISGLAVRALRPETRPSLAACQRQARRGLRWWAHYLRGGPEDRRIQQAGHEAYVRTVAQLAEKGLLA